MAACLSCVPVGLHLSTPLPAYCSEEVDIQGLMWSYECFSTMPALCMSAYKIVSTRPSAVIAGELMAFLWFHKDCEGLWHWPLSHSRLAGSLLHNHTFIPVAIETSGLLEPQTSFVKVWGN